jgi:hypothetical protein
MYVINFEVREYMNEAWKLEREFSKGGQRWREREREKVRIMGNIKKEGGEPPPLQEVMSGSVRTYIL